MRAALIAVLMCAVPGIAEAAEKVPVEVYLKGDKTGKPIKCEAFNARMVAKAKTGAAKGKARKSALDCAALAKLGHPHPSELGHH